MRSPARIAALTFLLLLAACAGSDSKPQREPVKLDMSIVASSGVNPDDQKRAAPIVVRVYELKDADAFNQADFYSLQDKDKTVLNDDLVQRDQFQLRPGEQKSIRRSTNSAASVLGVLAAYRDLPNSVWRATWPLPSTTAAWYRRAPKLTLVVDLDASAIKITDPALKNK
ncbi:lipoprotein [Caballeronia calidae]|uniref:Lipoprotein n=1 Tax=Caballeronia calidae TaxID=1777139 RepID=A0A158D2B4_9BURK|nr:type VI secretion system lipoprotein TssJ [Caballeronia calidae]SAK88490.1 lipoprotein [Caballeronia calidae]